jgi:hypothetical protein
MEVNIFTKLIFMTAMISSLKNNQKLNSYATWYLMPIHIGEKWTASAKTSLFSRIWGSHGGEYEDGCLLGCSTL